MGDAQRDINTSNVLIGITTVISFITLAVTVILLFLKITRWIRVRAEYRMFRSRQARIKGQQRTTRGRNAYEEDEWEGVPS